MSTSGNEFEYLMAELDGVGYNIPKLDNLIKKYGDKKHLFSVSDDETDIDSD